MADAAEQAEAFKAIIEAKIKALADEFAEGKISREQFHLLYERYNARLAIIIHAILSGNPDVAQAAQTGPPTITLRQATMGRVRGLIIYHNIAEKLLETLGEFDIVLEDIQPLLDDLTLQMIGGVSLDTRLERIDDTHWLLIVPGQFTTVIALFAHEPAQMQVRQLERMQRDFERANIHLLQLETIQPDTLAVPFQAIIQGHMRR
ncbi:MAG: hypothetical protein ACOCYT_03270 [Chloroflexota bacterium]